MNMMSSRQVFMMDSGLRRRLSLIRESTRKRGIWCEEHLASGAAQIRIEKIQEAGMAKECSAQRKINESNGRLPLASFNAVAHAQNHRGIQIGDGRPTYGMGLPVRGPGQIDPQFASERRREDGIVRAAIQATIEKLRTRRAKNADGNDGAVGSIGAAKRRYWTFGRQWHAGKTHEMSRPPKTLSESGIP